MGIKRGKDPTDKRIGSRDIHEETVCCSEKDCRWHKNTPAQSEEDPHGGYRDKGGPREWTDD